MAEDWLEGIVGEAVSSARCRLLGKPVLDYDLVERWLGRPGHPCGDVPVRVRLARRLCVVKACLELTLAIPTARLVGGVSLLLCRNGREGLWLLGPGIDPEDPLDLAEDLSAEPPAELRAMLLEELESAALSGREGWPELRGRSRLWFSRWGARIEDGKVPCRCEVDVEAAS